MLKSLEMDLQRTKKEQVENEEARSQLNLKYKELKWIYWQVKRKCEKCKTEFNYAMEVGKSVCAEYLYYKQSYTDLLEYYRQLWSACYATPAGSSQEQERSDHRTAQKSTAVLPLNLKSRKVRSSLSKGRSLLWHLLTSRPSKERQRHQSGIALELLPYATSSVRFSKDKLEELELPQFQDKSSSVFPKAPSSVGLAKDELEAVEALQLPEK